MKLEEKFVESLVKLMSDKDQQGVIAWKADKRNHKILIAKATEELRKVEKERENMIAIAQKRIDDAKMEAASMVENANNSIDRQKAALVKNQEMQSERDAKLDDKKKAIELREKEVKTAEKMKRDAEKAMDEAVMIKSKYEEKMSKLKNLF